MDYYGEYLELLHQVIEMPTPKGAPISFSLLAINEESNVFPKDTPCNRS